MTPGAGATNSGDGKMFQAAQKVGRLVVYGFVKYHNRMHLVHASMHQVLCVHR